MGVPLLPFPSRRVGSPCDGCVLVPLWLPALASFHPARERLGLRLWQEEGKEPTAPTELCLASLQAAPHVFLLLSIQSTAVSNPSLPYTGDWYLLRTLSLPQL